jgi:hypothetical protein
MACVQGGMTFVYYVVPAGWFVPLTQHLDPSFFALADIFAMYSLNRSFGWVSKSSIFYIWILGWAMSLTGHVQVCWEHRYVRDDSISTLKKQRNIS